MSSHKTLFLDDDENKYKSFDLEFINTHKIPEPKLESEADSEEGGSSSGSIALSVEQLNAYLLACFTKERRNWQKEFGIVPYTEDPNRLLGKKMPTGPLCGGLPHAHPLLALSQQFSGDDPKLTANPIENSEASERYLELRNENQLRKNPELGRRRKVVLSR